MHLKKYLPQFFNGRRSKVLILRSSLLLWLFLLIFWGTGYTSPAEKPVTIDTTDDNSFKLILSKLYHRPEQLSQIDIASSNYDAITTIVPLFHFLERNDYEARCTAYFRQLFLLDKDWFIDPAYDFSFHKDHFKLFKDFKLWQMSELRKEYISNQQNDGTTGEFQEPDEHFFVQLFQQYRERIRRDEQVLHDYISHIRIYDRCVLHSQDQFDYESAVNLTAFIREQSDILQYINYEEPFKSPKSKLFPHITSSDIESKLFPWLSFEYPIFQRFDGLQFSFPRFELSKDKEKEKEKEKPKNPRMPVRAQNKRRGLFSSIRVSNTIEGRSFLNEYQGKLNGKGIVLSIADKHVDTTIRLIRLLRSLGNSLPIEIVYFSDLCDEAKDVIVAAARDEYNNTPEQELWFVDVRRSIKEEYLPKFSGFGNKILATLFNSFEEMILIDADTVFLKPPSFFFYLDKYLDTGTMFYKDRSTFEFRPENDLIFFKKLMPSILDTIVFNIPQVSDHTLNNDFFKGLSHYMESGLVVIDRKKHFSQPLIMSQLNFHLPVQARVYGDKELFWLSLALAGDEEYSFNGHYAASIGELTPVAERIADVKKNQEFKSQEICSNHPGHINDADDHTLIWFNSGFRHCGQCHRVDFHKEFKAKSRWTRAKTEEEFREIFEGRAIITHAILPPFDITRSKARNNQHEPERSWLNMRQYCSGYTWCAYSLMGGTWKNDKGETVDTTIEGKVIAFTKQEIDHIKRLGNVWTSDHGYKVTFGPPPEQQ